MFTVESSVKCGFVIIVEDSETSELAGFKFGIHVTH